eukprot:12422094-Karenia_brevis.AAC.2
MKLAQDQYDSEDEWLEPAQASSPPVDDDDYDDDDHEPDHADDDNHERVDDDEALQPHTFEPCLHDDDELAPMQATAIEIMMMKHDDG